MSDIARELKLRSPKVRRIYYVVAAAAVLGLLMYLFRDRVVTYEMPWIAGEDAALITHEQNFDGEGNAKILLRCPDSLLRHPDPQSACFLIAYSNDFLTYLREQKRSTIPVTLRIQYGYGRIAYFEVLKVGEYKAHGGLLGGMNCYPYTGQ
jgi:hypothetical protein